MVIPVVVFSQAVTMIGGEYDDGVVGNAQSVEFIQQASHLVGVVGDLLPIQFTRPIILFI